MNILSRWMHLCVPECCLLCHASASGGICRDCLDDLCRSAVAGSQSCPRCGGIGDGISPCGSCQRKPPPFEKLWSSLHYEPPVSGLLHEFKHLRQIALKRLLAELMATLPPPWLHDAGIDGILAVPLSRERLVLQPMRRTRPPAVCPIRPAPAARRHRFQTARTAAKHTAVCAAEEKCGRAVPRGG